MHDTPLRGYFRIYRPSPLNRHYPLSSLGSLTLLARGRRQAHQPSMPRNAAFWPQAFYNMLIFKPGCWGMSANLTNGEGP